MNRIEHAIWIIKNKRENARFVSGSHSDEFIDKQAELGDGFVYVSLYDEKIDSNVIKTKRGLIIVDNSYLPSFAYNLALSWIFTYGQENIDNAKKNILVKNNFKKFFAEQLLSRHNNSFSRAIFLETLLYEEREMRPVFLAAAEQPAVKGTAELLSQIMSSLVVNHELGHIFLEKAGVDWPSLYGENFDIISKTIQFAEEAHGNDFATELKCDLIALFSTIDLHQKQKGIIFCLRSVAFGFAVFALMGSLTKSAEYTANLHKKIVEQIDLKSIKKNHVEFDYGIGPFLDMIERANMVIQICHELAVLNDCSLFGVDGEFSLHQGFFEELQFTMETIMSTDDIPARELSLMVAQAFDGHPDGINYLYLRSKVFTSKRNHEDQ